MVRSVRIQAVGLASLLTLSCALTTRGDEPTTPTPPADASKPKTAAAATPDMDAKSLAERARLFIQPAEDYPQPFVPLHPRTVEDRKQIEVMRDFSVARALEDRRAWSDAIVLLEDALKVDPDSVTLLRRLSRLCFILGRTDPAIRYSKRVLALEPGDTETISRLVTYFNRRNEPNNAESILKEVLANDKLDKHAAGRTLAEFELGNLYADKLQQVDKAADAYAIVVEALDDKSANRLSPADQRRILSGEEATVYQKFGLVFLQAKRYELAIKAFSHGLDYDPDDPQLPLLLAETLLEVKKPAEALGHVEHFLKRQPQGVEGYELLAKILTALKRDNEITPRLEEAARIDSKNIALQYALADRYRETGQVDRAEAMYKALLAAQPSTQGYGALAASLFKRRKGEELLKVIVEAVKRPGGLDAVREQLEGAANDPEIAEQMLDAGAKLLAADPPALDSAGIDVLAFIAPRAGKQEKLLPIQRLLLKRNPSARAYKELMITLIGLRKYADVTSTFEEMLTKYPDERNARQLVELARYYRLADKIDESSRTIDEALKLDPNDVDVQLQAAIVLSQSGRSAHAIEILQGAVKKDPDNPACASILGGILAQAGRNDEALVVLKGLLEKFPNNDEVIRTARSNLSIVYVNQGDFAKGEAELEILLERLPDDATVNNDLGYLYAEQGKNLEKAEMMIRKAIQEDPESSAYLDSLGWVLFKRGKVKEAVAPLEKAVKQLTEINSGDATIFEHLGDVYLQLQETRKAKSAWQDAEKAALKNNPPDKRLPEIRKKLESLEKLSQLPKTSSGNNP